MKKSLALVAAMTATMSVVAANPDPVLMTVDGRDIHVSEFQYLYNKNNSQQVEPLTFDQYVEMFVDYKLKVADALTAGIDTTKAFKDEFSKYRSELAEPYLRDEKAYEALIDEAYSHLQKDIKVSHIMMPATDHGESTAAVLDSIRGEILAGNTTFAEAAMAYSVDKNSALRGGSMGWITGNSRLPWAFEKMAYDTPVGQISKVVDSGFGNHIILVEASRPARGEVKAEHILMLTRDLDPEGVAQKKARIDSLYNVLQAGANFGDIAKRYSEDPGSARRGGDLGWFGSGMMVAEFDSVAFAMPVGGISEPFTTSYGYHIIHKSDQRGVAPLDEVRPNIEKAIERDQRSRIPLQSSINRAAKHSNAYLNNKTKDLVREFAKELGVPLTPEKLAKLNDITDIAYTINGNSTTIGEILQKRPMRPGMSIENIANYAEQTVNNEYERALLEIASETLGEYNEDYRNLINEYSDGIMLFEISNQKVWDKASKDKTGLDAYFQANRDKYTWDAPRFKSYVLFADNDSVLQLAFDKATQFAAANPGFTQEELTKNLKDEFGRNIKIEKVIAAKGENAITDYLGFGGNKPISSNTKWSSYCAFDGKVINAPEEAVDVKGTVVSDYQNALEKEWLDTLHKKYKVKINKKILNNVKKQSQNQ